MSELSPTRRWWCRRDDGSCEELLGAMGAYMEEMSKAGILLGGEGLHPSVKAARVSFAKGKPKVTDGPFGETKELIAGYSLIEVGSMQDAIAWAKRWPPLDAGGTVELEIRQLFEAEDFGPEFTPGQREKEERMRGEAAARSRR